MTCDHDWKRQDRLPRGYQEQCSKCEVWQLVLDDGRAVLLPQANVDRALGLLKTEEQIADLPETHE